MRFRDFKRTIASDSEILKEGQRERERERERERKRERERGRRRERFGEIYMYMDR